MGDGLRRLAGPRRCGQRLVQTAATCDLHAMIDISDIAETVPLPAAPAGWFDYGYQALMDGTLALVRTRRDVRGEYLQWWEAYTNGDTDLRPPDFGNTPIRLSVFDGVAETGAIFVPVRKYPVVDRTVDGRWIVATARAAEGEINGRIYAPDGTQQRALLLGDGISTLLCSPDGTFWVGYFDEGIFGRQNADGRWPVSSGGIVRFDGAGTPSWSFNGDAQVEYQVDDSYAMTLAGDVLWTCFYSDFRIVRVEDGKVASWPNEIAGAKAIAAKDDIVLLAGGYGEDAGRIAVLKLDGGASRELGRLRFPPLRQGQAGLVQGRGGTLHVVNDGVWSRLSVWRAAQAVASQEAS
jgi:hypothetical protein